jgi:HEAT repeat protein
MTRVGWVVVAGVIATGAAGSGGPSVCPLPAVPDHSSRAGAGGSGDAGGSSLLVSRVWAAESGAFQATRRAYEEVVADLGATNPEVRRAALRALGAGAYPQAIGPISRLLTDPEDDLQLEAIDTLLDFFVDVRPPRRKRVALVVEVRQKAGAEAVYDLGPFALIPRAVPPELEQGLAGAMRDQTPQVRLEATYGLGVMALPPVDPAAADAIVAALQDREPAVRLAAARVAGSLVVTSAGDALISAVNDQREEIRLAAMRSLGDIRERRAVVALREQFQYYGSGPSAVAALDALARIGDETSAPLFEQQLGASDPVFRQLGYEGLARSGRTASAASFEAAVASEKAPVAQVAAAFAAAVAGRPTVPTIVRGLARPHTAKLAMGYLAELGPRVVGAIEPALRDPDPRLRERAAQTLGLIGGEESVEVLQRAGSDPDVAVARAIERAVARARLQHPAS